MLGLGQVRALRGPPPPPSHRAPAHSPEFAEGLVGTASTLLVSGNPGRGCQAILYLEAPFVLCLMFWISKPCGRIGKDVS